MRDRLRQPRSNPKPLGDVQPFSDPDRAAPVVRIFAPTDFDLDDLAEAIRSLLGPATSPQIGPPICPKPDLLSFPHRGTHVVEANEAP